MHGRVVGLISGQIYTQVANNGYFSLTSLPPPFHILSSTKKIYSQVKIREEGRKISSEGDN